jgi:hypothetical protein
VVGPLGAGLAFYYLGQSSPYWISAAAVGVAALAIVLRTRPQAAAGAPPVPASPPMVGSVPESVAAPSATSEVVPVLEGSLAGLGLLPLLRFLRSADKSGCLRLSRDGWTGQVCLHEGLLVAASFGRDRGLAALDAILLVLSDAQFSFFEGLSSADRVGELAIDVDDLAARPPNVPVRQRGLAATIPTPLAVPRIVKLAEQSRDPTELVLRIGTLRTLLAVDGQRSVQELSDHVTSADVLVDLAILMDLSLINFDLSASRSGQLVGSSN